ncbi:hypothetical protein [Falsiroseomonas sp. HW251]|uniref:hypothetical protein n=1 Tax=Falsiroseomonas sp. HW251 TaxID=3390998 RepID=UPI003D314BEE
MSGKPVHVHLDDTLQLGLDAVAMLSPGRMIVLGWMVTPRGVETELSVAGAAGECRLLHCSHHDRPDVRPSEPRLAGARGFALLAEVPPNPAALALTLAAGPLQVAADLLDERVGTDLLAPIADERAGIGFGLLRTARDVPALHSLLSHLGRPFGAFADWLAGLPALRGRAEALGPVAEAEALATAAGEVVAMLRFPGVLPADATVEAVAIGWLRAANGIAEPVPLPFADAEAARLPAALGFYGRIDPAAVDRLHVLEIVLRAETAPGQAVCIRCQPAEATVPVVLDLACRTTAASVVVPVEAIASAGLEWLRRLVARREAAFLPVLDALAGPAGDSAALPRLALILGADDSAAARLFHVTAEAIEQRCDRVVVIGAAADDTAQVFARRGRVEVLVGVEAAAALRDAAGRAGVHAIDAAAYAAAVIAGDPGTAFARPLQAGETARLLALHAAAGCAPELTDSLHRLLIARRGGRFAPIQRDWANRHAGEMVNAHLERLWTATSAPREAAHG